MTLMYCAERINHEIKISKKLLKIIIVFSPNVFLENASRHYKIIEFYTADEEGRWRSLVSLHYSDSLQSFDRNRQFT